MADYSEEIAFVQEAIAEDGFEATLLKRIVSGPDNNPVITFDLHTIKCLELNSKEMVGGNLIERSMKTLYVSTEGLSVVPEQKDRVSFDLGVSSQPILAVRPLQPAGPTQVIMYEVDLS